MDMSSSSSSMSGMPMTFFNSHTTPLFSNAWTPTTCSAYAGTCIFLIILASILRLLFAFKASLDCRWQAQARQRRFVKVVGQDTEGDRIESDPAAKNGVLLTINGVEENVKVVQAQTKGRQAFRLSVDVPRATLVTVMAGVGYLLMLAVMTYNVGYFLSVLGGIFLGDLAVGRYSSTGAH